MAKSNKQGLPYVPAVVKKKLGPLDIFDPDSRWVNLVKAYWSSEKSRT